MRLRVDVAALALDRAVEEVARVELHARLGRRDVERAAALRLGDARGVLRGRRRCGSSTQLWS